MPFTCFNTDRKRGWNTVDSTEYVVTWPYQERQSNKAIHAERRHEVSNLWAKHNPCLNAKFGSESWKDNFIWRGCPLERHSAFESEEEPITRISLRILTSCIIKSKVREGVNRALEKLSTLTNFGTGLTETFRISQGWQKILCDL